jgi:uncharacterized membrane protein
MDIKFKNLVGVLVVLGALIAALIGYYFTVNVGAITVGTVSTVAQNDALNLSATMTGVVTGTETDFASNVSTGNNVVPIAFGLVALLAIILIFGFNPLKRGSGGKDIN